MTTSHLRGLTNGTQVKRTTATVEINGRRVTVNADAGSSGDGATLPHAIRDFRRKTMISLEPLLKAEKVTIIFDAIGDDKVRVTSPGWDDAKVILADQALEVTGMGKTLVAARVQRALEFLNVELNGLAAAGSGPETK